MSSTRSEPRRAYWRVALHGGIGTLVGYLILHHAILLVSHVGLDEHGLHWDFIPGAFSLAHLSMASYMVMLGAAVGLTVGWYAERLRASQQLIHALEGLLPICASCKRIRDDTGLASGDGPWQTVEEYIAARSSVTWTHGICPECVKRLYPEHAPEEAP